MIVDPGSTYFSLNYRSLWRVPGNNHWSITSYSNQFSIPTANSDNEVEGDLTKLTVLTYLPGFSDPQERTLKVFSPTDTQTTAMNSGITADKVTTYDGYQTSITEAKTQADKGVSDAAAAKVVADAALPTATFNEFETTNTAAIADAKKAGTDAQANLTAY